MTDGNTSELIRVEFNSIDRDWEAITREWWAPVSDWILGPGSITQGYTHTFTWTISFDISGGMKPNDFFNALTGKVGGSYSESYTETLQYQLTVDSGRYGRLVHIPNLHRTQGYMSVFRDWWVHGPLNPPHGTDVLADNKYFDAAIPIGGGQWEIQYRS
jgi:hypothetical protein